MEPSGINLLPKEEINLGEKTLRWALTTGRVIVVVTEFIVISAFLYRFVLDRRLTTANDSVEKNTIILKESRDTERRLRIVQAQLSQTKRILEEHKPNRQLVETVAAARPSSVIFDEIKVQGNEFSVSASTNETGAALAYLQKLKKLESLSSARIEEIGFAAGKVKFSISARIDWAKVKSEKI
jgi:Tfp pilus assembly protein PilN